MAAFSPPNPDRQAPSWANLCVSRHDLQSGTASAISQKCTGISAPAIACTPSIRRAQVERNVAIAGIILGGRFDLFGKDVGNVPSEPGLGVGSGSGVSDPTSTGVDAATSGEATSDGEGTTVEAPPEPSHRTSRQLRLM